MVMPWLLAAWVRWRGPAWLGLTIVGIIAVPYIVWSNRAVATIVGFDAYATWAIDLGDLYGVPYMDLASFRWSPAYAHVFSWAGLLPWELFGALWIGAAFAILAYWGKRWTVALIAFPPIALELYHGNIHLLMAAAIVVGFRYPASWAFLFLSKVTPGIAALWFLGRRDYRSFFIAVGASAVIAGVSFAIAPNLWFDFVRVSYEGFTSFVPPADRPYPIPIPFLIRAPIAAALALWGGATNRRWTVPVAAVLALPIIWVHGLAMLAALIPLLRWHEPERSLGPDPDQAGARSLGLTALTGRSTAGSAGR